MRFLFPGESCTLCILAFGAGWTFRHLWEEQGTWKAQVFSSSESIGTDLVAEVPESVESEKHKNRVAKMAQPLKVIVAQAWQLEFDPWSPL